MDSHFRTALVEISAVLNKRPLTYGYQSDDAHPLLPNDLLNTRYQFEEKDVSVLAPITDVEQRLRLIWKQIQQTLDQFWHHWRTEYLQFLRERNPINHFLKQITDSLPQINDIVLITKNI